MKAEKTKKIKCHVLINLIILVFTGHTILFAQQKASGEPTFSGRIKQSGNQNAGFDTLKIIYKKPYALVKVLSDMKVIVTDRNGNFKFTLPKNDRPYTAAIYVNHNGKYVMLKNHFFVEACDTIKIEIQKNKEEDIIKFYGKNSGKYTIVSQLYNLNKAYRTQLKLLGAARQTAGNTLDTTLLLQIVHLLKNFENQKSNLIRNSGLNSSMEKMVRYEYAQFFFEYYRNFNYMYVRSNSDDKKRISDLFNRTRQDFDYPIDTLMNFCRAYIDMKPVEIARTLMMSGALDSLNLEALFNHIKSKYSGVMRDQLITNLLISERGLIPEVKFSRSTRDSLVNEGARLVSVLPLAKDLMAFKLRLTPGEKLFEGLFLDLKGGNLSTAALKGKVVLIDIWGLGCSACAMFHKNFYKYAYPLLKDNKDFVYLSVSGDRVKQRWETGLKSNLYSAPEYLNVNLGPLGLQNHSFTKYYRIESMPFLLIVDRDGRIYSSNVGGAKNAYSLIKSALKDRQQN